MDGATLVKDWDLETPKEIHDWYQSLPTKKFSDFDHRYGVFIADMVNGFCKEGALLSPRVSALVEPVTAFAKFMLDKSVALVSIQDEHRPDALEFEAFPKHCVEGTEEADLIPELKELGGDWFVLGKDTLSAGIGTALSNQLFGWTEQRNYNGMRTAFVIGNCTDLCVYQLAMYIHQWRNEMRVPTLKVVVPANLVQTYDVPGHSGDFFHQTFLYHMALNGITVVKEVIYERG